MSRPQVRPFDADDIAAAGALLAARHGGHRTAQPLLAARYEDAGTAAAQVAEAFAADGSSGAVAVQDGRLAAFLLGSPKPSKVWGPNIWIEAGGQAALDAETVRDTYACATQRWVADGCAAHYVLVPVPTAATGQYQAGEEASAEPGSPQRSPHTRSSTRTRCSSIPTRSVRGGRSSPGRNGSS
jgi:hypothetical protein